MLNPVVDRSIAVNNLIPSSHAILQSTGEGTAQIPVLAMWILLLNGMWL